MAFIRQNQVVANVFPNQANKLFLTVKRLKKVVVAVQGSVPAVRVPEVVGSSVDEGVSPE